MKNLIKENTYWIALSHLQNWKKERLNQLIIKTFDEQKISLDDFFNAEKADWAKTFLLTEKEIDDIQNAKNKLSDYSTLSEKLLSQGIEIILFNSPDYSTILKDNLEIKSPPILYIKGNKKILNEDSIAIVGSRDASEIALQFTDNIAKQASKDYKVVISGFAKGVDRQALDSAIKYKGHSIIVLPQGIMTFNAGTYFEQIENGNVLVLSTFAPKSPWSVPLAMARNSTIYGLAKEIFVAQANEKGGTWAGVMDGLKKGRTIYVRNPEHSEQNANELLIKKGAIPVDFNGIVISNVQETKGTQLTLFS